MNFICTFQVALEGRAGALSSICSFLRHCPQLANSEDITKRLMGPLDAAVTMLTRYIIVFLVTFDFVEKVVRFRAHNKSFC